MKRVILMVSLILTAASLLIPPRTHAETLSQIIARYDSCDGNYNYDMTHYPDELAGDCRFQYEPWQCEFAPDPESCIESYRTTCQQTAFSNYTSCVGAIGPHRDSINFCAHAYEIADQCSSYYPNFEDYEAYSACVDSSGISQCE